MIPPNVEKIYLILGNALPRISTVTGLISALQASIASAHYLVDVP